MVACSFLVIIIIIKVEKAGGLTAPLCFAVLCHCFCSVNYPLVVCRFLDEIKNAVSFSSISSTQLVCISLIEFIFSALTSGIVYAKEYR